MSYTLQKTPSGRYLQFLDENALFQSLNMYGYGDGFHISKKTANNCSFSLYWDIAQCNGLWPELGRHTRLYELDQNQSLAFVERIIERLKPGRGGKT